MLLWLLIVFVGTVIQPMKNLSKTSGFCLLVDSFRYLRVLIYIYYIYTCFCMITPCLYQVSLPFIRPPVMERHGHSSRVRTLRPLYSLQFFLRAKDTAWQKNIMDRLMFIDVRGEQNIGFIVQNAVRLPRIYSCCAWFNSYTWYSHSCATDNKENPFRKKNPLNPGCLRFRDPYFIGCYSNSYILYNWIIISSPPKSSKNNQQVSTPWVSASPCGHRRPGFGSMGWGDGDRGPMMIHPGRFTCFEPENHGFWSLIFRWFVLKHERVDF